ncbi:ATPase, T2SS/T4P/T4SS family [Cytobacillus sp. IB215665]|uniref:ATPase, T2SS/T4P/T4SS family n=1 Tax=Cytobacillus sp. IB215665 TaxID=3097357 RepID=UPI002A0E6051|nr:ATPase, T2SS/T4P/T4SS family [Cytobacillus sp. IB215665]MDX8367195.1 ATPase, T2SS/T4P/T4SS family [Cytobacillus sp. IB215665]
MTQKVRLEDQKMLNHVSEDILKTLQAFVEAGLNILIVGPAGSEKTDLFNYLVKHTEDHERLLMYEANSNMNLKDIYPEKQIISLDYSLAEQEDIVNRTLLKNTLYLRPDRILIGECRVPEATMMLESYSTGYHGIATIKEKSWTEAIQWLIQICKQSGWKQADHHIGEFIASTFDIVISLNKVVDNNISISEIVELREYKDNTPIYTLLYELEAGGLVENNLIFSYLQKGFLSEETVTKIYETGVEVSMFKHLVKEEDKELIDSVNV